MDIQKTLLSRVTKLSILVVASVGIAGCQTDEYAFGHSKLAYGGSNRFPVEKAKKSNCGDWSVDSTSSESNEMSRNHGCAVQSNIAAMIANPKDRHGSRKSPKSRNSTVDVSAIDRAQQSVTEIGTVTPGAGGGGGAN